MNVYVVICSILWFAIRCSTALGPIYNPLHMWQETLAYNRRLVASMVRRIVTRGTVKNIRLKYLTVILDTISIVLRITSKI